MRCNQTNKANTTKPTKPTKPTQPNGLFKHIRTTSSPSSADVIKHSPVTHGTAWSPTPVSQSTYSIHCVSNLISLPMPKSMEHLITTDTHSFLAVAKPYITTNFVHLGQNMEPTGSTSDHPHHTIKTTSVTIQKPSAAPLRLPLIFSLRHLSPNSPIPHALAWWLQT